MDSDTHYQRMVRWFQARRAFAVLSFAAAVIVGVASVSGALDTLAGLYQKYFPVTAQRVQIDPAAIRSIPAQSHGYLYDVHAQAVEDLGYAADELDRGFVSELQLLENGVPLAEAHASHQLLRERGAGRYSHWDDGVNGQYLFFSASDNSDPRTNGYEYRLQTPTGQVLRLDPARISPDMLASRAYRYRGPGLELSPANSDCDGGSQVSRLRLLEVSEAGERALYPPHSPRRAIEDQGEGRFNHCKDGTTVWLFFSTSDGFDPRRGDLPLRHYVLTVDAAAD